MCPCLCDTVCINHDPVCVRCVYLCVCDCMTKYTCVSIFMCVCPCLVCDNVCVGHPGLIPDCVCVCECFSLVSRCHITASLKPAESIHKGHWCVNMTALVCACF